MGLCICLGGAERVGGLGVANHDAVGEEIVRQNRGAFIVETNFGCVDLHLKSVVRFSTSGAFFGRPLRFLVNFGHQSTDLSFNVAHFFKFGSVCALCALGARGGRPVGFECFCTWPSGAPFHINFKMSAHTALLVNLCVNSTLFVVTSTTTAYVVFNLRINLKTGIFVRYALIFVALLTRISLLIYNYIANDVYEENDWQIAVNCVTDWFLFAFYLMEFSRVVASRLILNQ